MKNSRHNKTLGRLASIFVRFNVTIFIVTLVGGLVIAVMILTNIMQPSSGALVNTVPNNGPGVFDDATIERLNKLKPTSESDGSSQNLPTGRINPFAG